jgi:hypothetical protein
MLAKPHGPANPPRVALPQDDETGRALARFRDGVRRALIRRGVPRDAPDLEERIEAVLAMDSPLRLGVGPVLDRTD